MSKTAKIRKSTVITGCAIVLGSLVGACSSTASSTTPPANTTATVTGTAPVPSTSGATSSSGDSGTSTTAGASTGGDVKSGTSSATKPGTSQFLSQTDLPNDSSYVWTKPSLTDVNVEHPLPDTCNNPLGTQVTQGVHEADYKSSFSGVTAVEDIYTYASAADAAAQMKASTPKCGGVTAHSADGFAWHGTEDGSPGKVHVLFVSRDNKVAALNITLGSSDYNSSLDAGLLKDMAAGLASS